MPFSEVVGHTRALALLSRSISRGSLPPSLLFTGPEGVGKSLVARAVAQALNCLAPVIASQEACATGTAGQGACATGTAGREACATGTAGQGACATGTAGQGACATGTAGREACATGSGVAPASWPATLPIDACGACTACIRIAKGTHPDVIVVEPPDAGATKIEVVRPAVAATAYRPFEGRFRAIIVDEAERLTDDAQNALLKSLEEPAASSVFVLVSSRPETLLATIRSRCSQVRFGRLPAADVARLLTERHGCDAAEANAVAAVADGSPGRALDAGSAAFREARDAVLAALRIAARPASPTARLQAASALAGVKSSSAGERDALATRLALLASLLRDLALLSNGGRVDGLANGDLASDLQELGPAFGVDRALRAFAASDRATAALRRNASPKIVAAWLSVQL